jgi:hypothetical protein
MQVHFLLSVYSVSLKSSAALLCALLLAACNAKVIEPMRLVAAPSAASARLGSDLAEPKAAHYVVPEVSNVTFSTIAQEPVVDLTY